MKKKIIYALSFGMTLFFAASCGNKTTDESPTEPVDTVPKEKVISAIMQYPDESKKSDKQVLDMSDFSKADFDLVKARINILSTCVGEYCSDPANFCNGANPACLDSIKKCHTIDTATYRRLTGNGNAVFPAGDLSDLLTADCKQYIQLTCSAANYGIRVVSTRDTTLKYTVYYSVALWQKIARDPIDSVRVHKAVYDSTSGKYLIPFKVYLPGGKEQVYDLSNDYP